MRLTSAPSFMNSVEEKLREARKKTRIGGVRNVRVSAYSIFSGKHGKFSFHNKENRIWIMLCIKQTPKKNGKTEKTDNADEPSERDTFTHTHTQGTQCLTLHSVINFFVCVISAGCVTLFPGGTEHTKHLHIWINLTIFFYVKIVNSKKKI